MKRWTAEDFENDEPRMFADDQESGATRKEFNRQKAEYFEQKEMEKLAAKRAEELKIIKLKEKIPITEALCQEICERIASGELLINIASDIHMPTIRKIQQYLKENPDFNSLYNVALLDRLSIFEDEIVQIADDATLDYKLIEVRRGVKKKIQDPEVIARAKLRIEVRFRHMKAGKPQRWGDSQTLITKDVTDGEDPSTMPIEELERRIADIEKKNRSLKK